MKFIDLPRRRAGPFEIALRVDEGVEGPLREHGWRVASSLAGPEAGGGHPADIAGAKDQYGRPRTGWFSDRSACYLAAGRPVIAQDTGFGCALPTGAGLFRWSTMDDILAAVDAIERDYERHRRAAREIAAAYFKAETVLGSLLARAGL